MMLLPSEQISLNRFVSASGGGEPYLAWLNTFMDGKSDGMKVVKPANNLPRHRVVTESLQKVYHILRKTGIIRNYEGYVSMQENIYLS
jgi:hypothetical protein